MTSQDFPSRPVKPPVGNAFDKLDEVEYQGRVDNHIDLLKTKRSQEQVPAEREFELQKIAHQAATEDEFAQLKEQRELERTLEERDYEREETDWAAELELYKAIHEARSKIASESVSRGQTGAEFVRNAAAGIVTIYTAVLGLVFGLEQDKPIPQRGLVPAVFLALSLALAAAYVAFLSRAPELAAPLPSDSLRIVQERRLNRFIDWATGLALHRAWALHAAVIALAVGAATLPLPFANVSGNVVVLIVVVGVGATILVPIMMLGEGE